MTEQRLLLCFSYHEHDWDDELDWAVEAEAELLRRATYGQWEEAPDAAEPDEFDTVEALAQQVEDVLVGEWEMPAAAARLPIDKLRAVIADGGWTFAAGGFSEYEGHHNDTELLVKLVRPQR
ncbi:hypothetical protein Cs7R123_02070 [Catellatospora sp. TT07R-123]|uniref:hypothetical protein n=1 Tax=Catellatospora sp. TT07R-123 TaxID=2733863 RepID=UPI001B21F6C4|nr:hypothetical protein [Catellatospora sp. TT07R-123]GHJ42865.1 hypothetical protein Cs7R123_02070 [Catellatospora sp. TT07R-123]